MLLIVAMSGDRRASLGGPPSSSRAVHAPVSLSEYGSQIYFEWKDLDGSWQLCSARESTARAHQAIVRTPKQPRKGLPGHSAVAAEPLRAPDGATGELPMIPRVCNRRRRLPWSHGLSPVVHGPDQSRASWRMRPHHSGRSYGLGRTPRPSAPGPAEARRPGLGPAGPGGDAGSRTTPMPSSFVAKPPPALPRTSHQTGLLT